MMRGLDPASPCAVGNLAMGSREDQGTTGKERWPLRLDPVHGDARQHLEASSGRQF